MSFIPSALRTNHEVASAYNKYKVIQKLGSGGNGVAFLVQCVDGPLIGNFFTLKFLNRIDLDGSHRFRSEIAFIKDNKHPSILSHYDEGEYQGRLFVVAEYLRHTLYDVIGKLELKDALIYSVQLLSAINYLQLNGYVHRDIKPKNIFLDNSNAVLGDFGLVKKIGSPDSTASADIEYLRNAMPSNYRTPQLIHYMNTGELSIESDVFQLGLVLYELFTGDPLLKATNKLDTAITEKSFNVKRKIPSEKYGARIQGLINKMTEIETTDMLPIGQLLISFQSILSDYFEELRQIEFKIIL